MFINKLIADANNTYKLGLDAEKVRRVESALKIAGYKDQVLSKDVSTVIDIVIAQAERLSRYNPLKEVTARVRGCPICGKPMEKIVIANGKEAEFCKDHNLTLPSMV